MTGRIGPNAIIQTAAVLADRLGSTRAEAIVHGATGYTLDRLPSEMVNEGEVNALVHAVRAELGDTACEAVMHEAGGRTAEYLIAHRIPRPAQWLMRVLPHGLGLRVLLAGIGRHTWTFAGSAAVTITAGAPSTMTLVGCPMCRGVSATIPCCAFYVGTLQRLVARLVTPTMVVRETACEALGHVGGCRFEIGR